MFLFEKKSKALVKKHHNIGSIAPQNKALQKNPFEGGGGGFSEKEDK